MYLTDRIIKSIREGGFFMYFLTALLWYIGKFIFLAGVSVGGVYLGKKLRERKDAKC